MLLSLSLFPSLSLTLRLASAVVGLEGAQLMLWLLARRVNDWKTFLSEDDLWRRLRDGEAVLWRHK
jgi:hypothetical protein